MIRNIYSNHYIKLLSVNKNASHCDHELWMKNLFNSEVMKYPIILSNSRRRNYHNNNNANRSSYVKNCLLKSSGDKISLTSCKTFTRQSSSLSSSTNLYNSCAYKLGEKVSNKVDGECNNDSNIKRTNMGLFKFSDYDCVGFDLDNTLLRYNITNMVNLEYETLSKFLVETRKYDSKHLYKPLDNFDYDFMQKGLILDFDRGNVLRLSPEGYIIRASHGTKIIPSDKLDGIYPDRRWKVTDAFSDDFLVTWNGPLSEKMRTLLDYFDMPASLVFARIIDTLDENDPTLTDTNQYNIWPDILDGLIDMFDREHFKSEKGRYFSILKNNPSKFMHRSSDKLVSWLKDLKAQRITYLITGSNADFADFTATYALGRDWKSLFDIIICYAKKPGFFTGTRPFLSLENNEESSAVLGSDLKRGSVYSQGNWKELKEFFARETGKDSPSCLYVGDNLIQDIYTPKYHAGCDTVAVVEEQLAEGMLNHSLFHSDEKILNSNIWGSYFRIKCNNGNDEHHPSIWSHVITNYAKICIPSVELIVDHSLDTPLKSFGTEDDRKFNGYHPGKPKSVDIL